MQSRRAIIVGIFVLIGVIILMAAIFTLGGQKKTFSKGIPIKAVFDDVNGLQAGNNIWFSGVKVGTVRKLQLISGARVEVDMNLDQKSKNFIRKDAKAKIGSDGLIGNKIIIIYGGTPASPSVQANDMLQNESVLGTDEMMNTLQANNKNLLEITNDFKLISRRLANGEGTIGKLLTDDNFLKQLQSTVGTLQKASVNIQLLSSDIAGYTSKLQTKGVFANDLVTDTTIFQSLRTTIAQIQQASDNANEITKNLKIVTGKINDSSNLVGTLLHDQQTSNNLKATMENLQSGTERLNQDMEALQHNFLLRGYFKKQAKHEKEQQEKQAKDSTGNH